MAHTKPQSLLTLRFYAISAFLYGTYVGRVCPLLETLSVLQVLAHTSATFAVLFLIRQYILQNHSLAKSLQFIKLDTTLFFFGSIPLALYYNFFHEFTIDSNLKVVFGITLFGFFTGSILQLIAKTNEFDELSNSEIEKFHTEGKRHSMIKNMIVLVVLLLSTLTLMLTMVAVKDIYWLEHNPMKLADGTGKWSIIKEFVYVAGIMMAYVITIMMLWSKLMKKVLQSQEESLLKVSRGDTSTRLPIFAFDELGSMASLTNSMLDHLQYAQSEVKTTRDVAIVSLSALAESRDNETGAHILRTQEYVKVLAEHLSTSEKHAELLTPNYIELLYKSAPLHDVGKVGIPDNVLLKPGKLTDEEFEIMKGHPQIGAEALSIAEKQLGSSSFLRVAKEISLTHHEKWDGNGYPNRLAGEEIPLSGRLMALADVYDALISKRVYKPAFTHEQAKAIILEGNGSHFDPEVVEAFLYVEKKFIDIAAAYQDKKNDISELERESFVTQPV
ncbi:HD domain-containing protein [Vibrio makurazakiensis]|uniref:HD domain-containing phosphohydrolase n=1 Tax=Vibrio makurazakiensis TaxID=2910250 RepID=UPI003D0BA0FD